jgi:uncharacterized protein (TIGR02246 family)
MRWPTVLTFLVAGFLLAPSVAGAAGGHLEVPDSAFSSFDGGAEYDHAVRQTLFEGMTDSPYLRMLVKPSFSVEWMVLVTEPGRRTATVRLVVARKPVWTGEDPKIRETLRHEAELPAGLAELLRTVWLGMLEEVRYPEEPVLGVDGTTYHFTSFVRFRGNLEGRSWSPPVESPAGRLVAIGRALRRYAEADAEALPLIAGEIRELASTLDSELETGENALVRAVVTGLVAADNAGDLEAVMAAYTEDAVLLPPGGSPIAGGAAIREHYAGLFAGLTMDFTVSSEETVVSGDWAFNRGITAGVTQSREDGAPTRHRDHYFAVLRKGADGWRIARLIWNPAAPPGARAD